MSPATVSVVIPCRDQRSDVLEALESVFAQTVPALEVIVIDDGSSDGSGDAVRERFGSRVRVLRAECGCASGARNVGWRAASGTWIAFLDADDLWSPAKLEVAMAMLRDATDAVWFCSDGEYRSLDGVLHPSWFDLHVDVREPYVGSPLEALFGINFVLTSSVVVRRDVLEALGGFDETLTHGEDLDLWIRLARHHLSTISTRSLVTYRHREGGLTRHTVERLRGRERVFARLAADTTLTPMLRRSARTQATRCAYKLGIEWLRRGERGEARAAFARSWSTPLHAPQVVLGYLATVLPGRVLHRFRGARTLTALTRPIVRSSHVSLESPRHGTPPGKA